MGLREAQRAAKADAIREAALGVFEREGYEGATVEAIAAAAGVSLPTLFRYYPSKADLLCSEDEAFLQAWEAAIRRVVPGESLLDALIRATLSGAPRAAEGRLSRVRTRLLGESAELRRRQLELDHEGATRAGAAIAARLGREPDDPVARAIAGAAMGAVRAAQERWRRSGQREPLDVAIERALRSLVEVGGLLAGRSPG